MKTISCIFVLILCTLASCSKDGFECPTPQDEQLTPEQLLTRSTLESDAFITEWIVGKDSVVTFTLDTNYRTPYNCIIDWGDNSSLSYIFSKADYYKSRHIYYTAGVYRIRVLGNFPQLNIKYNCKPWLSKIIQWGNVNFETLTSTFANCTNLVSIAPGAPNIPNYTIAFINCSSLQSLPDGLFKNCTKISSLVYTFGRCINLTTLPAGLFEDCINITNLSNTFYYCGLKVLPERLFANCINTENISYVFAQCKNLTVIPPDLFTSMTKVTNLGGIFHSCTSLTFIPLSLFDNCKAATNFSNTFYGCTSLTGPTPKTDGLEIWERQGKPGYPVSIQGTKCFTGDTGLTNYSTIPQDWL